MGDFEKKVFLSQYARQLGEARKQAASKATRKDKEDERTLINNKRGKKEGRESVPWITIIKGLRTGKRNN